MAQTYLELQQLVETWLIRDDLSDQIKEAIELARLRFNRSLRVPEMEADVTATIEGPIVTLPDDFLQARAVSIEGDLSLGLEQVSLGELVKRYPTDATGLPRHYAIQSGSEMLFGPAPDGSYTLTLNYYQAIPALVDDSDTNWLLTSHSDIYLLAALAELWDLLHDEARADRYEKRLIGRVSELNKQARGKAWGAAPVRLRSHTVV